jgi:hypothetical protein
MKMDFLINAKVCFYLQKILYKKVQQLPQRQI